MLIDGQKGKYEIVIGLEVHAQLQTENKLFSGGLNDFSADPNSNLDYFDLAMPGSLPVLNRMAVDHAIRAGLAIEGRVNNISTFDRKNYFYADLPAGYQITQFYHPIVTNGHLEIYSDVLGGVKTVRIARIHMEQDAGKLIHDSVAGFSCVDLNRAGVPLIEIVSEPDMRSPAEAIYYLKLLRSILRTIGASSGDMEAGAFRCDANISVRQVGSDIFGTRCEIKNLNSFKFIGKAIEYEARRHIEVIESGGMIVQETRLFDPNSGETQTMREKEGAADYRYFPDPDLLPLRLEDQEIEQIKSKMPELPNAKKRRYIEKMGLLESEANAIVADMEAAKYFDILTKKHSPKLCFTWLMVELLGRLNKKGLEMEDACLNSESMLDLLDLIEREIISGKIAKEVLDKMLETGKPPATIIKEEDLVQISNNDEILSIIKAVVQSNLGQYQDYKAGKLKLYGFFVGEVMKVTKGRANPSLLNTLLRDFLDNSVI